jgi:hypothetical protein
MSHNVSAFLKEQPKHTNPNDGSAIVVMWGGNDFVCNTQNREQSCTYRPTDTQTRIDRFINAASKADRLVLLYSEDHTLWQGLCPNWTSQVQEVIRQVRTSGIEAICIDPQFRTMDTQGCRKNPHTGNWHWKSCIETTNIWIQSLEQVLDMLWFSRFTKAFINESTERKQS